MKKTTWRKLVAAFAIALVPASLMVGFSSASPAFAATSYVKYPWSSDIYNDKNVTGTFYATSYSEWVAAGSPTPRVVNWVPGSELVHYATNTDEVFLEGPGHDYTVRHHLTAAEFRATGRPASEVYYRDSAFYGYTWNGIIVQHESLSKYSQMDLTGWALMGKPTPVRQKTFPLDRFCRVSSTGAIYFSNPNRGITSALHLTAAQYAGAGSPTYRTC